MSTQQFGLGCYTKESVRPVFSQNQLLVIDHFTQYYKFSRITLGHSKRVVNGIVYCGQFVGRSPQLEAKFKENCVDVIVERVRTDFACWELDLFVMEMSNQSLRHRSMWHEDCVDQTPFLNVMVALDDMNESTGMTTLRWTNEGTVEMKCKRNHYYSFDGGINHCAGPAMKPGAPRRFLMCVFRRRSDPLPIDIAFAHYKGILTRRKNGNKKRKKRKVEKSSRVLRLKKNMLDSIQNDQNDRQRY